MMRIVAPLLRLLKIVHFDLSFLLPMFILFGFFFLIDCCHVPARQGRQQLAPHSDVHGHVHEQAEGGVDDQGDMAHVDDEHDPGTRRIRMVEVAWPLDHVDHVSGGVER